MTPEDLEPLTCVVCATTFMIEKKLWQVKKAHEGRITCPNGHSLVPLSKGYDTQLFELRTQLAEARAKVDELKEALEQKAIELRKLKCDLLAFKNEMPETPDKKSFWQKIGL